MDKRKRPNLDGFVPRRSAGGVDPFRAQKDDHVSDVPHGLQRHLPKDSNGSGLARHDRQEAAGDSTMLTPVGSSDEERRQVVSRSDVDESLKQIDEQESDQSTSRRRKSKKHPHPKRRKVIKWSIIVILLVLLAVAGWVGYKAFVASRAIFKGDIFGIVQQQDLKQDANGRSNILVFGTSEDDPEHPGGMLTDSIMVLSINQKEKNAYMISLPRDLYVRYFGEACIEGYQGRINSLYECFSENGKNEDAGAGKLAEKAGDILGLDVQYYAHLNYTVVRDAVNAVGGVDVKIESNPPGVGILDRNFDWKCGYRCYYVKYDDGQVAHLDGEHALALARARNAAGGYGLAAGNFDREKNQQKILKALREKAVSAGTLTNLTKVTSLIDAFGNNLRTNFETSEIRTLMSLGTDISSDAIKSISLVEEGNQLVTTDNIGGASIVRPVAGLYDYTAIHSAVQRKLNSSPVSQEAAHIVVLNASGLTGVAGEEADKLEKLGLVVSETDNVPAGKKYTNNTFYKTNDDKPKTLAMLKSRYGASSLSSGEVPVAVGKDVDFVIVIYDPASVSSN